MKIAYFSPLPPKKSGISDYSADLLPYLAEYCDIDVYTDHPEKVSPSIKSKFSIIDIENFLKDKTGRKYDHLVYQIGNSDEHHRNIYRVFLEHSGIAVLHDYSLHHMIAQQTIGMKKYEDYVNEMKYNYGIEGVILARQSIMGERRAIWGTEKSLKYPLNKSVLDRAKALIVHSSFLKDLIFNAKNDLPVRLAPLPTPDIGICANTEKAELRKKYGLPENKVIISSFGLISKNKRIHKILKALEKLSRETDRFLYVLVGEEQSDFSVKNYVKELKIPSFVRCTGFVNIDVFKDYIKMTDIAINLRYPTQGETSASLIRLLGMGIPVLVTEVGTFCEFPDTITVKVPYGKQEVESLFSSIKLLLEDEHKLREMSKSACQYIKQEHSVSKTALSYYHLLRDIQKGGLLKNNVHAYKGLFDQAGDALYSMGTMYQDRVVIRQTANKINELI